MYIPLLISSCSQVCHNTVITYRKYNVHGVTIH